VTRVVTSLLWALWLGLLLFSVGWLILRLRAALTPVFFALLFAYALDPLVDRLEAARMPRSIGIAVLLCVVILLLGLFVFLVLPAVVRDLIELEALLRRNLGAAQIATVDQIPTAIDVGCELVHGRVLGCVGQVRIALSHPSKRLRVAGR
jgi:predicted PurR-regulated permease PerM